MPDPIDQFAAAVDQATASPDGAQPTPKADPFATAVDAAGQEQEQGLRSSLYVATARDPEQHAKALSLADQFHLPVESVEAARDQLHQAQKLNAVDVRNLIGQNPRLVSWLTDHDNATIGQDDLAHLQRMDDASGEMAKALSAPDDNRPDMPWLSGVGGRYARRGVLGGMDMLMAIPASLEMAGRSLLNAPLSESDYANPGWSPAATIVHDQQALRDEERAAQTYHETLTQKAAGGLWEMLANPVNVVAPMAGGAAASIGLEGAAAAKAALTGASLVMGEQSAIQALQSSLDAQQRARLSGESGPITPGLRDIGNAATQGVLGYFAGYLGGLRGTLRGLNPKPMAWRELPSDLAIQAGVGMGQGSLGALTSGAILPGEAPSGADVLESGVASAFGNLAMTAGGHAVHMRAQELAFRINDAQAATVTASILAKAGTALVNSKAFARNGERALEILRGSTRDGSGVAYLQADDLPALAQAHGVAPEVLYDRLGITQDQVAESQATKSALPVDVVKMLGTAAKAGPKAVEALVEKAQSSPEAPNLEQVRAFAEQLPDEYAALQHEADAAGNAPREQTPTERIHEDVKQQLLATGHDEAFAEHHAAIWAAHYGATAFWWNQGKAIDAPGRMDPHAEYQANPLRVVRSLPETLTNPKSGFGQKLAAERQTRAAKWSAEDAAARKIDVANAGQQTTAEDVMRSRAAGDDGQAIINKASAILQSEAKRTGRVPGMTDIMIALGSDFGFKPDASVKLNAQQQTAGDLFRAALRHRGVDLKLLGEEAAMDAARSMPAVAGALAQGDAGPAMRAADAVQGSAIAQRMPEDLRKDMSIQAMESAHLRSVAEVGARVRPWGKDIQGTVTAAEGVGSDAEVSVRWDNGAEAKVFASDLDLMREAGRDSVHYQDEGNVRGSYEPEHNRIRLFESENLSTFSHETGHAFLTHMESLATRPDAPAIIKDDVAKIRDYLGAKDGGFTRAQHETWARSWEAYLMEGKAPSPALAGAFGRFRTWLTSVYRSILGLSQRAGHEIKLTDEVRGVMDRMLATEDEISAAQAHQNQAALFGNEKVATEAGMTTQEREAYNAAVERARQGAEDTVMAEQMTEEKARRKAEASAAYRKIHDEVADEVDATPAYQALRALRNREVGPGGERIPGLDREMVAGMYKDSQIPSERRIAARLTQMGVTAKDGHGINPDLVAPLFGYDSGDAMVRSMVDARPREALIREEAKNRLHERHPDLLPTSGSIAEQAMRAVHGKGRADVLRLEVSKLGQRIGKKPAPIEVLRRVAQDRVSRQTILTLRPDLYRTAEAKAARAAFNAAAKGDFETAFQEKQREALNYELQRAAQAAKDDTVKMQAKMVELTKPAAQERIGKAGGWEWTVSRPDGSEIGRVSNKDAADALAKNTPGATFEQTSGYQEQINGILERFDLKPVSGRQIQRRRSLQQWVQMMADDGFPVDLPDEVTGDRRANWKELTVDELRGVHDGVVQIEHLATLKNRMLAAKDKAEFSAVRDGLVKSIVENAKGPARSTKAGKQLTDGMKLTLDGITGSLERLGDILQHLDGFKDGGSALEALKFPFDEAANREAALASDATADLHKSLATWEKAGGRGRGRDAYTKTHIPAIGQSLSRLERIMVALNCGNEGNRSRLEEGFGWNSGQTDAVLATLDKHDAALVRDIAAQINAHWSEIAAKVQRLTGVRPEKVEGQPFTIAGEKLDGFYFPVIYDRTKSADAAMRDLAQVADAVRRGAFTAATTKRGHTKERTEGSGAPLSLEFGGIGRHLNQVFHDLTHHEALIDANRLLRDRDVRSAIEAHYGPETVQALAGAMQRIGGASVRDIDGMERAVQIATRNVGRAAMGFNVWTAVQNLVNVTQSMERVGVLRFIRAMAPMVGDAAGSQSLGSFIHGKSEFMARRYKLSGERIGEETATGSGAIGRDMPDALRPYAMMENIQKLVDYPTWKAAYDHALEESHPDAKAVLMADQAVVDSQAGKDIKDKAGVLEGSEYKKLMTMFYGYFNSTFNMSRRAYLRTDFHNPADIARLGASFLLIYAIPTALSAAGMAMLRPDKKRDGQPLPGRLSAETLAMMMATVPVLREVSTGAKGLLGDGGTYSGPASMRGLDTLNQMMSQIGGAMHGKGDKIGKTATQTAGLVTGLPTVQLQRTLDGFLYDLDHQSPNPAPVLFGKPK